MPSPIKRLMRISPQQLRAFEATARLMSITRAARELHVSQPTISVQLRQVAELIGEPLFEPVGRGIRLTLAGEALVEAVGEISATWQRFEGRLSDLRGLVRGRLRIAAVTTAEYFVPDLLGPFGALHPGIDIELAVENRDRVIARLHQQVDDLAVMMLPPDDLPLQSLPFMDNPLVVIGPAQHRLARLGHPVPLEELTGERWLMREPGSGTRWVAEKHFASHGFTPRLAMSLGSNEALKHAVGAGLGIGVISALAIGPVGPSGRAHRHSPWVRLPVEGFPILRQWSLVWRTDVPLSPPARQFVSYLEHQGKPSSKAAGPMQ
ncbi:LysR family transcriptional regulator [Hydrogenophaga bisanensis]|uniref:LysR family transcriptional regulator n=1 Tax=Hydrogenophaga bisanensis TaxID=439611 RepID=A0ABW2RBR0_9BURK